MFFLGLSLNSTIQLFQLHYTVTQKSTLCTVLKLWLMSLYIFSANPANFGSYTKQRCRLISIPSSVVAVAQRYTTHYSSKTFAYRTICALLHAVKMILLPSADHGSMGRQEIACVPRG